MPCDSSYMAPTGYELEIVATAKLLKYIALDLGHEVDPTVGRLSQDRNYTEVTRAVGDKLVATLCRVMHELPDEVVERLAYVNRCREARQLADWWEEHQAADRKRDEAKKKTDLDRGYLFPKGSGVPSHKKDEILKWYKGLGSTGQSYVNLLLLVRDNAGKKPAPSEAT